MRAWTVILSVGFVLSLSLNAMAVVDMAPFAGTYWYDSISNNASGTQPETEVGTITITSDQINLDSTMWPDAAPHDMDLTFTGATLDVDGYLTFQTGDGPVPVFANGHVAGKLSHGVNGEPLCHELMVRIAEDPTAEDLSGDYMMFRYAMHGNFAASDVITETEGCLGSATLTAGTPHAWSANFTEINSSMTPVNKDGMGEWTLDSTASTMILTGMESDITLKIGIGGILTSTVVDDGIVEGQGGEGESPARLLLIQKGAGRIVDDAVGRYTLQGFSSSTDGSAFWTTWGTMDLLADLTWTSTTFSSDETVADTSGGTFTIADDGTMTLTDDEGDINGILSLDGDLIALASAEPGPDGEINMIFAMRPLIVPEPSAITMLLLLGSLCWIVFRRRR